ncbi:MAG: hypothetical protein ACKVPY_06245 [Paracoccaceae bacterium]
MSGPIRLRGEFASARVWPTGAMLAGAMFRLPDGRRVRPLATLPWAFDAALPGHMRRLGGEFFCLPFGGAGLDGAAETGWAGFVGRPGDAPLHGPAANADWTVEEAAPDRAHLSLDLPEPFPVARIDRWLRLAPETARIDVRVRLTARADTEIPAGFHPILALPGTGSLRLDAGFAEGFTYPGAIPGARMLAKAGRGFARLSAVPGADGGAVDFSAPPLRRGHEDVLLLASMTGPVSVDRPGRGYRLTIDWDRAALPHAMLWLHDRGLAGPPWSGRFRGLGIEPVASAFDLAPAVSRAENPLARRGYATTLPLRAGVPRDLWLSLSVSPLAQRAV